MFISCLVDGKGVYRVCGKIVLSCYNIRWLEECVYMQLADCTITAYRPCPSISLYTTDSLHLLFVTVMG
jgi:hypothetical protein